MATATVERISYSERDKRSPRFGEQHGDELFEPLVSERREEPPGMPPPRPGEGAAPLSLHDQQQASLFSGGVNLAKAMLGVGVLALPKVTALLGVGTTLIVLAAVALLTFLSLHALTLASARSGYVRYSDVVKELSGTFGQAFLDLSLIINCFGILVIALVIVGDVLVGSNGTDGLLSEACGDRATVLAVVSVVLVAPLVSVTRMRSVSGASLLGVVAIVGWAILTVLLFFAAWSNGELHSINWWPHGKFVGHGFKSATLVIGTLPVVLVAFTCQMSLQHTLRDLQYVHDTQVDKVTATALGVCAAAYAALGICAYGVFGKNVAPDVLSSFTVDALLPLLWVRLAKAVFTAIRMGFLVSLLGVFPLQMAPLRDAIWKLLFRQELRGPGLWLVTYALLGGVYSAAIWVESIWEPLVLIGSTAGVMIALIFPGILAMKTPELLTEPESAAKGRTAAGAVLVVVGLVIGVFGLLRVLLYKDPFSD